MKTKQLRRCFSPSGLFVRSLLQFRLFFLKVLLLFGLIGSLCPLFLMVRMVVGFWFLVSGFGVSCWFLVSDGLVSCRFLLSGF